MSNLKAALEAAQQEPKPPFEVWVEALPDDDREALILAAASNRISHTAFHGVIRDAGAKVGKETVVIWRKAHGFTR